MHGVLVFFLWRSLEMLSCTFIFSFSSLFRAGYINLGFRVTHTDGWSYGSCRPRSYRRFGTSTRPRARVLRPILRWIRQAQHVTSWICRTYVEKATDLMIFYRRRRRCFDGSTGASTNIRNIRNQHRSRCIYAAHPGVI